MEHINKAGGAVYLYSVGWLGYVAASPLFDPPRL